MTFLGDFPDWTGALCAGMDQNDWFPERGTTRAHMASLKATCAKCPIRQRCLDFALDTGQIHGVWGGLSTEERQHIRGDRMRAGRLRAVPS